MVVMVVRLVVVVGVACVNAIQERRNGKLANLALQLCKNIIRHFLLALCSNISCMFTRAAIEEADAHAR